VNVRNWARRYPLAAFFVLAYAISWIVLLPLAILGEAATRFALILVAVSAFGPAVAAGIVTSVVEGRSGVRRWISRLFRWRVRVGWYLVALLLPFLLVVAAYGLYLVAEGSPVEGWEAPSPILVLATVLVIALLFGGQEELGWRGFALPRLQARYSALVSSLILAVTWTFWHAPNFFLPGTTQTELPWLWYVLLGPAVTILLTWIFNNTRGSLLPAMLFHGAVNAAPGLLPLDAEGGLISMRVAVLIAAWLTAGVVVAAFGTQRMTSDARWRQQDEIRHPTVDDPR
jgi:membrane protease YdiL (CAAX protease family)